MVHHGRSSGPGRMAGVIQLLGAGRFAPSCYPHPCQQGAQNPGRTLQVQQHGLWPTLQQLIRGLQGGPQQQPQRGERQARRRGQPAPGGAQTRAQRKLRFEEVARAVQALPMEEFVTRQDLERCSLHTLRVRSGWDHHTIVPIMVCNGGPLMQGAGILPPLLMRHVHCLLEFRFAVCNRALSAAEPDNLTGEDAGAGPEGERGPGEEGGGGAGAGGGRRQQHQVPRSCWALCCCSVLTALCCSKEERRRHCQAGCAGVFVVMHVPGPCLISR